ncbi:hypothetical protein ELS19_12090 [Halogeometricum borinquense]|nr:hypothetical protein ELS19_12090 [Halogeometricum borinquense]
MTVTRRDDTTQQTQMPSDASLRRVTKEKKSMSARFARPDSSDGRETVAVWSCNSCGRDAV